MNGITNRSRNKSAYNVFYSTLCAELKTESHADQRIIMGDDLLRPFQQQLIADDLAAQAAAFNDDDSLDADELAEAEDGDDDDDDDDGHRFDAYFDIRVKRRMVCARTHARLGSTMPLTYHDWTHPVSHFIPYQVPSSTYLYVR